MPSTLSQRTMKPDLYFIVRAQMPLFSPAYALSPAFAHSGSRTHNSSLLPADIDLAYPRDQFEHEQHHRLSQLVMRD
ncbi:hypothetical protein MOSE0_D00936 [Monosporozyma servazzii]